MKRWTLVLSVLVLLVFSACTGKTAPLPDPPDLYAEILAAVEMEEMTDVSGEMLEMNTGITAEEYVSAVYGIPQAGMAPDEIIIVQAKDSAAAEAVRGKLQSWLDYRRESAKLYLSEYQAVLREAVIRRDGTTVSLLVSPCITEIESVYLRYGG